MILFLNNNNNNITIVTSLFSGNKINGLGGGGGRGGEHDILINAEIVVVGRYFNGDSPRNGPRKHYHNIITIVVATNE